MSRRKRSSLAEDLVELAALLPWWLCLTLAPVSYAVLHPYATAPVVLNPVPGQMGSMMNEAILKGLATGGQYILPIILVTGALVSFLGRRKREALVRSVADQQLEVLPAHAVQRAGRVDSAGQGPAAGCDARPAPCGNARRQCSARLPPVRQPDGAPHGAPGRQRRQSVLGLR